MQVPFIADERGRLTVPNVIFLLASFAFVAALWPVVYNGLQSNAGELSAGEAYLLQLILPFALLVIMSIMWVAGAKEGI